MSEKSPDAQEHIRRAIPRWVPPTRSLESGASILKEKPSEVRSFAESWLSRLNKKNEDYGTEESAAEAYLLANLYGLRDVPEPTKNAHPGVEWLRKFSADPIVVTPGQVISADLGVETYRRQVSRLRHALTVNPRNSFGWSELARCHTVLGNDEKALSALRIAISIAPNHPYLLRAANRFFHHMHESGDALSVIHNSPGWQHNPWLVAAEIASQTVAGRVSKQLKKGLSMVHSERWPPNTVSELSAAIATEEMKYGAHKKATKLFEAALVKPTGNAIAQVAWAKTTDQDLRIRSNDWSLDTESKAITAREACDWEEVIPACVVWSQEEPYATRPLDMAMSASIAKKDAAGAQNFLDKLRHLDADPIALGNYQVLLHCYQGQPAQGLSELSKTLKIKGAIEAPYLLATTGLVGFRGGLVDLGRECYELATYWYLERKDYESATSAILHGLQEELTYDEESAQEVKSVAQDIKKSLRIMDYPELRTLCHLMEMGHVAFADSGILPAQAEQQLRSIMSKFSLPKGVAARSSILDAARQSF